MKTNGSIIKGASEGNVENQETDMSMTQSADNNSTSQGGDGKTGQTIQDSDIESEQTKGACPESNVENQERDMSMTQSADNNSTSQGGDDRTGQTIQDSDMESEQTKGACPESKQSERHTCGNRVSGLVTIQR